MHETVRIEDIAEELETFNVKGDEECLQKLKELCCIHHQAAEDIVEQWVAFSFSNSNCPLTTHSLQTFQKDFLAKELSKSIKQQSTDVVHNTSLHQSFNSINDEEDDVIDAYLTPDSKKRNIQATPDSVRRKALTSTGSPVNNFSPSSFSSNCSTPSQKYKSKIHLREILSKFGDTENTTWKTATVPSEALKISSLDFPVLKESYPFMFEKLRNKAMVLDDMDNFSERLMEKHSVDHLSHVRSPQSDEAVVVGRICCDGNGRMNPSSIILEGSQETSCGSFVQLDVQKIPEYSLFPGQLASFAGANNSGKIFTATRMLLPDQSTFLDQNTKSNNLDMHVAIACGPFTTKESLSYEPLYDFVKYVIEHKPHVCILLGPFIDTKNEEVEKGNFNGTYEELFENVVTNMMKMTESLNTEFIVVPSYKDAHHDFIYPTPPYSSDFLRNNPRMHLVSDPSLIKINGIVFGLTSSDILLHLGKEEIWFPPNSHDRLKRLASHLIKQRSFYPLFPPAEEMNIDFNQYENHVTLPVLPHILVVPSELRNFIKDVEGCCCINPERIAKGILGGTFARMQIKVSPSLNLSQSIISNVSAEVLRI